MTINKINFPSLAEKQVTQRTNGMTIDVNNNILFDGEKVYKASDIENACVEKTFVKEWITPE